MNRTLVISPGFPAEMPLFTRALIDLGSEVVGLGEGPGEGLPDGIRGRLVDYWRVPSLWREEDVIAEVLDRAAGAGIERVECLWEPGVLLAARIREALRLPGMDLEASLPFRDKERMKLALDAAGIRTPRHERAGTETAVRSAAERLGYPLIVKPIAGAGSMDTFRVDDRDGLEIALGKLRHIDEVSVEEYIEGEEYTYDTICADGKVLFENVSWYRPKALVARTEEWVSPQTVAFRDLQRPECRQAREMGHAVLRALDFREGFTHMEWFRRPDGEAVFGEIACRPPGARSVDIMGQATGADPYRTWAEAVTTGRLSFEVERPFNSVVIFKRARGMGRIARVEGLESLRERFGEHIVSVDLLPPGASRRDWKQTLLSDGWITIRHPELESALSIADAFASELHLFTD